MDLLAWKVDEVVNLVDLESKLFAVSLFKLRVVDEEAVQTGRHVASKDVEITLD